MPAQPCATGACCHAFPWLLAASHPTSQAAQVPGSAEGQHLGSRAAGFLSHGMRAMLMLLAPSTRQCWELSLVVG